MAVISCNYLSPPQTVGAGHVSGPAEHREQGEHAEHTVGVAAGGEEEVEGEGRVGEGEKETV